MYENNLSAFRRLLTRRVKPFIAHVEALSQSQTFGKLVRRCLKPGTRKHPMIDYW